MAPMELTEELEQWARQVTRGVKSPEERLRQLWHALLDLRRGGMVEVLFPTPSAVEAFEGRQANCVGLALLLVALAREVEVPAFFVTVRIAMEGPREGDFRLRQEHLAVGVGPSHDLRIFDFGGEEKGRRLVLRPVSDLTALALFHSNRGVEALLRGETSHAETRLRWALELDPELAESWVNLGVVLRRRGDRQGAEAAYRRALAIDPETVSAYSNLAALLDREGRPGEAHSLQSQAEALQRPEAPDPLQYLERARRTLQKGDLEAARRWFDKALASSQAP